MVEILLGDKSRHAAVLPYGALCMPDCLLSTHIRCVYAVFDGYTRLPRPLSALGAITDHAISLILLVMLQCRN